MNTIVQLLGSNSFLQAAFLLLQTAFLVPIVKAIIDFMNFKRQTRLESELARQTKVIKYETKLLDDIHKSLWEYRTLVKYPALYKKIRDEERYKKAVQKYDEKADDLFSEIRAQVGMTQRLASPEVYQKFLKLFKYLKEEVNVSHLELVKKSTSGDNASKIEEDWKRQYDELYGYLADRIDQVLYRLAKDFGLIETKALPNEPPDPDKKKPTSSSGSIQNRSSISTEEKGEEMASLSPSP